MTDSTTDNLTFDYQYDPDTQIHTYIFFRNGREVVDAWFAHLTTIVQQSIQSGASEIRLLVDVTEGGQRQPVNYTIQKAKELERAYPEAPMRRYVVLGNSSTLEVILKPLFAMLKTRITFRYFLGRDRAKALDWLTSTTITSSKEAI
jgi:hypothetical protein